MKRVLYTYLCEKYQRRAWDFTARPSQKEPEGNWKTWLILAGRGFGKTRTGAQTIAHWVRMKGYRQIALIGYSVDEVKRVMVKGPSGILESSLVRARNQMRLSSNQLLWSNGAVATFFGARHYDKLRGPQFDAIWIDELAKFPYPDQLWEQVLLSLRLGNNPRCIITTTPRPVSLIQRLSTQENVYVTRGTTFENHENLSSSFIESIQTQFRGTRLEAQELYGQVLSETQGALWTRNLITYHQPLYQEDGVPMLMRIVIGVDPAATHHDRSDETGIVVVGIDENQKMYVLEDLSGRLSPLEWGERVVDAYWRYKADRIVAEVNKGGDMVERILRSLDLSISYKAVRATRGKMTRAEPVAALYEQKRVFHAAPFEHLENQLCQFIPHPSAKSPDRLDALVWAITDLALDQEAGPPKIWGMG